MSTAQPGPKPFQVAAAVIGNALEWYDFLVFGFLTVIIAQLFFPSGNQYLSLLFTTGTFGVGFFMRPIGGIVLGIYADRRGRKAALLMVIVLMTVAMAMIAFAPTYAAIGVGAPLIIVLARLLQGFSAGGEFASATTFLIESAPAHGVDFTAPGKWSARVWRRSLARFWGRYLRAHSRTRRSTPGVGVSRFCSVSSSVHWDFISAAISMRLQHSYNRAELRWASRLMQGRSRRVSRKCWLAWDWVWRARFRSI